MPMLSRASSGLRSTARSVASERSAPACACIFGSGGTTCSTTQMATVASTPMKAKMPAMPIQRYIGGASTSEIANTSPIEAPITAMVLVRCSSRVRSAASAITAAEIAPAPWMKRPRMVSQMSSASAAMKLPSAKRMSPMTMIALAAVAVGGDAVGNLQHALRQAVDAQRDADEREVVAAPQVRGVHREHRQDQEQPQHAQGEDRRPGTGWRGSPPASCANRTTRAACELKKGWRGGAEVPYSSRFDFRAPSVKPARRTLSSQPARSKPWKRSASAVRARTISRTSTSICRATG